MDNDYKRLWSFNRNIDKNSIKSEDMIWQGPFSWIGYENEEIEQIPNVSGVYLLTFEYNDGYIIRSVGVSKSIKNRFKQHNKIYLSGGYTILDIEHSQSGIRKELWHGWNFAKINKNVYVNNEKEILDAVHKELSAYRVFICEVDNARKRERIEASILMDIYTSKSEFSNLLDGGMHMRNRFNYEMPIYINNKCQYKIYGLSSKLEI